jgi:hypothetical protein
LSPASLIRSCCQIWRSRTLMFCVGTKFLRLIQLRN